MKHIFFFKALVLNCWLSPIVAASLISCPALPITTKIGASLEGGWSVSKLYARQGLWSSLYQKYFGEEYIMKEWYRTGVTYEDEKKRSQIQCCSIIKNEDSALCVNRTVTNYQCSLPRKKNIYGFKCQKLI